jgi:hypothetical protein
MHKLAIADIRRLNKASGRYWFSAETMRFFNTRALPTVYQGADGIYFVTSEQFVSSDGIPAERKFSVRCFNPDDASISTVGPFNNLSETQAKSHARGLAAQ